MRIKHLIIVLLPGMLIFKIMILNFVKAAYLLCFSWILSVPRTPFM
jgi:uncharacterized membrane protein YjjB (DUF3815 family)